MNGGSTTNLTYDLNGNMTSDGTNAYAWDADNRMIKITYPGTNNFSSFVYDGYGRNVSIVETTAGSVTSTKQFVWSISNRKEERDGSGVLTKKFFERGQMNSATKYFYFLDHLGSVREMTDNSGVVQAQYSFDPYGQITKISETIASDFDYAGYYTHARSGLNLTLSRAYTSSLGRFINRDPIEEIGGINLYGYGSNDPVSLTDPSGMSSSSPWGTGDPRKFWGYRDPGPQDPGCSSEASSGSSSSSSSGGAPPPPPGPNPPNPPNTGSADNEWTSKCKPIFDSINERLKELKRRVRQQRKGRRGLPLTGKNSVQSHAEEYKAKQMNLSRLLVLWTQNNCGPIPEGWLHWLTRDIDLPLGPDD